MCTFCLSFSPARRVLILLQFPIYILRSSRSVKSILKNVPQRNNVDEMEVDLPDPDYEGKQIICLFCIPVNSICVLLRAWFWTFGNAIWDIGVILEIHYIAEHLNSTQPNSVLMLCTPSNCWQPFSYHAKMVDFEYFHVLSVFSWNKLA